MDSTLQKPLRILHLIPHLSGGGAERQLTYLSRGLADRGHAIHVAYLTEGPDPASHSSEPIHYHRLRRWNNYDPRILWGLYRLMDRIIPDIVQTWIPQMDILGGMAFRKTRTRWILREPSCAQAWPNTWKNRLRIWSARRASAIVANSMAGCHYWNTMTPDIPCILIPNAVPVNAIDAVPPMVPRRQGVLSQDKVIVYAGRFSEEKNLPCLLNALACLKKKTSFVVIFCGTGPLEAFLRRQVYRLGMEREVHFEGICSQQQVWAWVKRADVLVSLGEFEGCPNAVLEAMACRCRLLVSDIPAHRELLDDTVTGFVNPHDEKQTQEVLWQLLSETEEDCRIRKARLIAEKMTINRMVDGYEKLYRKILAGEIAVSSFVHEEDCAGIESLTKKELPYKNARPRVRMDETDEPFEASSKRP
ncbi:MAG: glycosyltransferase family 4 protein [Sedimentisphaerales bacterium]|nr:glycosyltransferase family 4 protein [Sedimentisphaerales bacterium]